MLMLVCIILFHEYIDINIDDVYSLFLIDDDPLYISLCNAGILNICKKITRGYGIPSL